VLLSASNSGHVELIKLFLDLGMDINYRNKVCMHQRDTKRDMSIDTLGSNSRSRLAIMLLPLQLSKAIYQHANY
jgi:hypothetical protein